MTMISVIRASAVAGLIVSGHLALGQSRPASDTSGENAPIRAADTATATASAFPVRLETSRNFNILEPNYFLTGGQDLRGRDTLGSTRYAKQVKFRVAVRYHVLSMGSGASESGLYFAYTQNSFWNLYENSAPFYDNNYNPMALLFADSRQWTNGQPGYMPSFRAFIEHESNGRDGAASRGWNRVGGGIDVGSANTTWLSGVLRGWHAFDVEDGNAQLPDYAGRGELLLNVVPFLHASYPLDLSSAGTTIKLRVGGRNAVTSTEVNVFLRLTRILGLDKKLDTHLNPSLALQWFSGTSENLLDYNVRRTVFRVGFATVR